MARLRCPKCKCADVERVGGKLGVGLNLNPLRPFTLFNHKPIGKQEFVCTRCGKVFKAKI